jgi:hypothetical protein
VHTSDARFLLPQPVERALVLGPLDDWRAELEAAGVVLDGPPDVVVTTPADLVDIPDAPGVIVVGGPRQRGWAGSVGVTPVPRRADTGALVPLGSPPMARAATTRWARPANAALRVRNAMAARLVDAGIVVPGMVPVWVRARRPGPPWLLRAAADAGLVDLRRPRLLVAGRPTSRSAFLVAPDAPDGVVVKFARDRRVTEPFLAGQRGLRAVAAAGRPVAAHAPRLLGRLDAAGHIVSVESALPGTDLSTLLARPAPGRLLPRIEEVADWLVEVARATARPPEALEPERERLRRVLADPAASSARAAVAEPPHAPAVLRHGDLGTWNVLVDDDSFGVVDWETVVLAGYPLWDLLHFLQDALGAIDLRGGGLRSEEHFVRLFRGELASSHVLFAWVRRLVDAIGIPADDVGAIATSLWADQAVTVTAALRDGVALDAAGGAESMHISRLRLWMADPQLGHGWDAWQQGG